jgi:coniferyl-aldehyde dehydrogenase
MKEILLAQREAFLREGPPSATVRVERIDRLMTAVLSRTDEFVAAMGEDFGNRPRVVSLATDIVGALQDIRYVRKNVRRWMRPRKAAPGPLRLVGVRAWIEPCPLGVVGIIAPWNFPLALALQPTVAAFAAGNRVMIKMSEQVPCTAGLLQEAVATAFSPTELAVITGDVGPEFSSLPFDHLLFTGSPKTGQRVLEAAAENLTPVTLELGGKNPAVVGHDADLAVAAARIAAGRMTNGGQLCLSPDYVFVPRDRIDTFVDNLVERLAKIDDADHTRTRHADRQTAFIDDARALGADVVEAGVATVLLRLTDEMRVMREEIFGPLIAVLPYDDLDEVIAYINARPTPLAAYYFGTGEFDRFKARTRSGGITRDDFALHSFVNGLPFGGVGASGMGAYHGRFGFDTFSHPRAVALSPKRFSVVSFGAPPFPVWMERLLRLFARS